MELLFATYDSTCVGHAEHFPETLAVLTAAAEPKMHHMLLDHVTRMVTPFMVQDERNAWQLQLWGIYSTYRTAEYRPNERLQSADNLQQWDPVSRVTAKTHGDGHPVAKWGFNAGRVDIQVSHNRDYLYFNSPLQGNFVVEGDVTTFGFRGSHFGYSDTEIVPSYTLKQYALCRFRSREELLPLTPQAWGPREWFRCRLKVADGTVTAGFNGHPYPSQKVEAEHDPWMSLCSPVRFNGGARNLRITGDPVVPEVIALATSRRLAGWLSYYEAEPGYLTDPSMSRFGTGGSWAFESDSSTGGIVGRLRPHLNGCYNESLLRYHRPMLEDG